MSNTVREDRVKEVQGLNLDLPEKKVEYNNQTLIWLFGMKLTLKCCQI